MLHTHKLKYKKKNFVIHDIDVAIRGIVVLPGLVLL